MVPTDAKPRGYQLSTKGYGQVRTWYAQDPGDGYEWVRELPATS